MQKNKSYQEEELLKDIKESITKIENILEYINNREISVETKDKIKHRLNNLDSKVN